MALEATYKRDPTKARELYSLFDEEMADHERMLGSLRPGRNGKSRA